MNIKRIVLIAAACTLFILINRVVYSAGDTDIITLPEPKVKGILSLEETIVKRRSRRRFADRNITLEEISQLLWQPKA